jgi:hypothetical protein
VSAVYPDDFVSTENPEGPDAGEFSGVGGLVQPPPHDPNSSASEQLMILHRTLWHGDSGIEET